MATPQPQPRPLTGEPALVLTAISAAVSLIVTLNIGLTPEQGGLWVAVITAVFGLVVALLTRPIAPAAFTTVVTAVGALLMGYHFHVDPAVLAQINSVILAVLMLGARHQVTPVNRANVDLAA